MRGEERWAETFSKTRRASGRPDVQFLSGIWSADYPGGGLFCKKHERDDFVFNFSILVHTSVLEEIVHFPTYVTD